MEVNEENIESDMEEEFFEEIYALCKEAYEDGVDSADIFQVLHDPAVISVRSDKDKRKWGFNWLINNFKRACGMITLECVKKLGMKVHEFFVSLVLCIVVFGGGGLAVCNYFCDFNPLMYVPLLAERQCLLPAHPVILEMVRPIENCSICTAFRETDSVVVEFKKPPGKDEFLKFAYSSRPIIVRRLGDSGNKNVGRTEASMPSGFNFARLKQIFESEAGGVDSVSEECQFLPFRSPFSSLRDAFDSISDDAEWDKPWYIGWSNCHPGVAAKLRKMFPRPNFLPSDSELSAIDWIFIGSPGLGAAMHIDYVRRPSWQAQLSGTKKWILKPPPECETICRDEISFTINPGDMIFVDTNIWFHETRIEGNQLSISIGSEYD